MTRWIAMLVAVSAGTLGVAVDAAQAAPAQPVTMHAEDITLADALDLLARQAGTANRPIEYLFEGGADSTRRVTVSLTTVSFDEALRTLLDQTDLTYEVDARGIYRIRPTVRPDPGGQPGLIIFDAKRPAGEQRVRLVRLPIRYLDPVDVVTWFGGVVLTPRFSPGFGMIGATPGGNPNAPGMGRPSSPSGFPGMGVPGSGLGSPRSGFPGTTGTPGSGPY